MKINWYELMNFISGAIGDFLRKEEIVRKFVIFFGKSKLMRQKDDNRNVKYDTTHRKWALKKMNPKFEVKLFSYKGRKALL